MKKLFWTTLVILIIFSGNACHKSSTTTLVGNWTKKSDFDGVARWGAVSFCIDKFGYIGFGQDGRNYITDFWKYDSEQDFWTQVASCPATGRVNAVGFSIGTNGYVGTGTNGNLYMRDFWSYQSDQNSWLNVDSIPNTYERTGAVGFALNNKGYMGTGYNGKYLKDFWVFDPTITVGQPAGQQQWKVLPGFGGEKREYATTFIIDNKAYLCTGIFSGAYVTDFWRFDPATETWEGGADKGLRDISTTVNSNYRIARANGIGFSSNGKGYITLGASPSLMRDVWEYDPATDLWSAKTSFEGASRSDAVGFSINNRMFVTTGRSSTYLFEDTWEFKPNDAYDATY